MQALNLREGGRAVHPISWCDIYQSGGPEALDDRSPRPDRVWNRIPDMVREQIIKLALDEPALSPRELAVAAASAGKGGVRREAPVLLALDDGSLVAFLSPRIVAAMGGSPPSPASPSSCPMATVFLQNLTRHAGVTYCINV